jgi:hypothetical protein
MKNYTQLTREERYQIIFVVGYLLCKKKNAYGESRKYFEDFLNNTEGDKSYQLLQKMASSCIREMDLKK